MDRPCSRLNSELFPTPTEPLMRSLRLELELGREGTEDEDDARDDPPDLFELLTLLLLVSLSSLEVVVPISASNSNGR